MKIDTWSVDGKPVTKEEFKRVKTGSSSAAYRILAQEIILGNPELKRQYNKLFKAEVLEAVKRIRHKDQRREDWWSQLGN